ncbi:hypothetical protein NG797_03670 [Laspinema sp. D5]|nr:hypothetical protein [Laspinema sp. D3d]
MASEAEAAGLIDCCTQADHHHYFLSVDGQVYKLKDISTAVILLQIHNTQSNSFVSSVLDNHNNISPSLFPEIDF